MGVYRGHNRASRLGTYATRVQFTIPTLKDAPVGSRVADIACPLDQRIIRLDELERVRAVENGDSHVGTGFLKVSSGI